jgi:dipeptidase E
MNYGVLLLTSTGLSFEKVHKKIKMMFSAGERRSVAIITTAAEGKENNKYSQLAKKQFEDIGFDIVDFVDLENELEKDFSSYGIIYVCGGNTFKLLKFSKEANLKYSVENLLKRDGIYIGVSAGSIIVGPSITIAGEVSADKNDIGLEYLTGLSITDLIVLPHYSSEMEEETKAFEVKYGVNVERVSNSQAILVENGQKTIIE